MKKHKNKSSWEDDRYKTRDLLLFLAAVRFFFFIFFYSAFKSLPPLPPTHSLPSPSSLLGLAPLVASASQEHVVLDYLVRDISFVRCVGRTGFVSLCPGPCLLAGRPGRGGRGGAAGAGWGSWLGRYSIFPYIPSPKKLPSTQFAFL